VCTTHFSSTSCVCLLCIQLGEKYYYTTGKEESELDYYLDEDRSAERDRVILQERVRYSVFVEAYRKDIFNYLHTRRRRGECIGELWTEDEIRG